MLVNINGDIILCLNYDEIIGGIRAKSTSWGSCQQVSISSLFKKTDSIYRKGIGQLRMNGSITAFHVVPITLQSEALLGVFWFCF